MARDTGVLLHRIAFGAHRRSDLKSNCEDENFKKVNLQREGSQKRKKFNIKVRS